MTACRLMRLLVALLVLWPTTIQAADAIPGPIVASVVSVSDGDTITVNAHYPWPGTTIRTAVRIKGIDTPEMRGLCEAETELAKRAREFVAATVGEYVELTNITLGKYAGRRISGVSIPLMRTAVLIVVPGHG